MTCTCIQCGKALDPLTSFGLSTPIDETRISPADFCGFACIMAWVKDMAEVATGKRRRQ
jgi:hypothetical protein